MARSAWRLRTQGVEEVELESRLWSGARCVAARSTFPIRDSITSPAPLSWTSREFRTVLADGGAARLPRNRRRGAVRQVIGARARVLENATFEATPRDNLSRRVPQLAAESGYSFALRR